MKKSIVLVVVLAFTLTAFAACSGSQAASHSAASSQSSTPASYAKKDWSDTNLSDIYNNLFGDNKIIYYSPEEQSSTPDSAYQVPVSSEVNRYEWYDSTTSDSAITNNGKIEVFKGNVLNIAKNGNGALHSATYDYTIVGDDGWTYTSTGNGYVTRPKLATNERLALKVLVGTDGSGNESRRLLAWANRAYID